MEAWRESTASVTNVSVNMYMDRMDMGADAARDTEYDGRTLFVILCSQKYLLLFVIGRILHIEDFS